MDNTIQIKLKKKNSAAQEKY